MIKPNLIANISIKDYGNDHALVIPSDIVQEDAEGKPFVYKVANTSKPNVASLSMQYIQTGYDYDGKTEVVNGLAQGDVVVSEGAKNMRAGLTVSLKQ